VSKGKTTLSKVSKPGVGGRGGGDPKSPQYLNFVGMAPNFLHLRPRSNVKFPMC